MDPVETGCIDHGHPTEGCWDRKAKALFCLDADKAAISVH